MTTKSRPKPGNPKAVPTTLNLDSDVRDELVRVSKGQDRSMSWVANQLLRERWLCVDCKREFVKKPNATGEAALPATKEDR